MMIGPDLLAAPVTADRAEADGEAGRPTPVSVYLPPGRWLSVFGGHVLGGSRTIVVDAQLDEFPIYMRAGSAIGFNARTPDIWTRGWTTDELTSPRLAGWLSAPGGTRRSVGRRNLSALAGASVTVGRTAIATPAISSGRATLNASTRSGRVRLLVSGAPVQVQILVLTDHAPRAVTVDGFALPHRASIGSLRAAGQGWMMSRGALGGMIVKLSPRNGTATVTIVLG